MKEVTAYQSQDGKLFASKAAALARDIDIAVVALCREVTKHSVVDIHSQLFETAFREMFVDGVPTRYRNACPPYSLNRFVRKISALRRKSEEYRKTKAAEESEDVCSLPF